jgi:hypothetical protein
MKRVKKKTEKCFNIIFILNDILHIMYIILLSQYMCYF